MTISTDSRGSYLFRLLVGGFFALSFLPLLLLSFFNHPSPADDYCYIDTALKYGFWQAQRFYYEGWSGRFFAYFLAHGNPLLYNFPAGFKIYACLLLLFFFMSVYRLAGLLAGASLGRPALLACAGVLTGLYLFYVPSIAEAFFWMITSLTNTLPVLLLIWLLGLLEGMYRQQKNFSPALLPAALLIVAIVGCSEMSILVVGILLVFFLGFQRFNGVRIRPYWWILLGVFLVASYFVIAAPGNAARMQGNQMSGDLVSSFVGSVWLTFKNAVRWIFFTPVWAATLLYIPLAAKIAATKTVRRSPLFSAHPVLVWVLFFGILAACFFPTFYGGLARLGELDPPHRNFNTVYLLFLTGWFYAILVTIAFFLEKNNLNIVFPAYGSLVTCLLAGGMWVYMIGSPNFKPIYRDLLKGTAFRYDRQLNERYRQIRTSTQDTVVVAPLKDIPSTLFVDDIRVENEHLWNRCYSGYYGKTVVLAPTASQEHPPR